MTSTGTRVPARPRAWRRFLRRQDGTALAEFAISFPTLVVLFAIIVESARMLFAYQAAIGGVRDAARYFGRAIPADVCVTAGRWNAWVAATGPNAMAATIVGDKLIGGGTVFPGAASLTGATPVSVTHTCPAWTGAQFASLSTRVAVVQVSADVRIDFPLGGLFAFFGAPLGGVTTTVTDTSRVIGS